MKIKIMSDLHLEFGNNRYFERALDTVLVLAGDIHSNIYQLEYFLKYAIDYH